jgi:hypothetical protein
MRACGLVRIEVLVQVEVVRRVALVSASRHRRVRDVERRLLEALAELRMRIRAKKKDSKS